MPTQNSSLLEKLLDISTGIRNAYTTIIDVKNSSFDGNRNVMNLQEAINSIPLVMTLEEYDEILALAMSI